MATTRARNDDNASTPSSVSAGPPKQVRIAGIVVALQGFSALVLAIVLLVRAISGVSTLGANGYAMAGYFVLLGSGVLVAGVSLLRGRRWARTPSVVVQFLLIGVGYYAISGASSLAVGLPAIALGIAVLALLFVAPSRNWAMPAYDDGTSKRASGKN